MHRSLLSILICPSCRCAYAAHDHGTGHAEAARSDAAEIIWGYLQCPRCAVVIPIAAGFAFFTEPLIHAGLATPRHLRELAQNWFGSDAAYATYRQQRSERGGHEPYAAFHPFNESTRAVDALMPWLGAHLEPGAFILEPWARTGFTGEWLASSFPQQRVVALWEGERSVLGYRGYHHWLGAGKRADNLDILFVHPERGLPFRDGSFGLIYALDSFHRFSLVPFGSDCWRVARPDAALALAHTHLTNSEPDPWFDRGCIMRHGRDYRAWLDQVLQGDRRRGWVVSEVDLFQAKPGTVLSDNPGTSHYNGFVLIADPARRPAVPIPARRQLAAADRLLVNPMFRLFLGRQCLRVDPGLMNGSVGELFFRHPAYRAHLPQEAVSLDCRQLALFCLAVTGLSVSELGAQLGCDVDILNGIAAPLITADALLPTTISAAGFALQRFHANQLPAGSAAELVVGYGHPPDGREPAVIRNAAGDMLAATDLPALLALLQRFLQGQALGPGRHLAIAVGDHPLGFALALAACLTGIDVDLCRDKSADGAPVAELLVHADGASPGAFGPARRYLPLGLDGGAASLLGLLADFDNGPSVYDDNNLDQAWITLRLDDRQIRLQAAQLFEIALSLAPATAVDTGATHASSQVAGFLSALIALARHETVLLASG